MAKIVNFIQLSSYTPIFFRGMFHFFVFFFTDYINKSYIFAKILINLVIKSLWLISDPKQLKYPKTENQ